MERGHIATELGVAYLSLSASTKDFARDVKAALKDVEVGAQKTGEGGGSKLGKGLVKGLKFGILGVAGLTAAVAGLAAKGGIERALKIEGAQAKLKGLGHDTKAVDAIMKNALASVKGTSFGLGEAASTAAGAVAAGIKPGEDLERVLKSVANSAAAAGTDMGDMGSIFNKVASIGKAQNDTLAQVADKGIPIYAALADQLGVTSEQVFKMASDGKIDFATFEKAMTSATGTVAEEMGKTLPGKIANFKAAMSRMGEQVVGKILPYVSSGLSWMTDKIDEWGPSAKIAGEKLGDALGKVAGWVRDDVVPALQVGYKWLAEKFVPALQDSAEWVKENSTWLGPMAAGLSGATVAVGLWYAAHKIGARYTLLAEAATKLWNKALLLSPVGLAAVAIAALVAGLVWFFTQTETGRGIVDKAWAGIKTAISAVTDWWSSTAQPLLVGGWEAIKAAAQTVADWYTGTLQPVFTAVWDAITKGATDASGWYQTHVAPVFEAFGELVRTVMESWVKPALEKIQELWGALAGAIKSLWETQIMPSLNALAAGWAMLWSGIKALWDKIGPPLMVYISGVFEGMKIVLGTIWNGIKIIIETALGIIKGVITTITAAIKGDWSGVWQSMKATNQVLIDGIKRQIENVFNGVKSFLSNAWTTIKDTAASAWGGVRDSVMGVIDPFVARIKSGFQSAVDGVKSIWGGIKAAAAVPVNFVINTVWNNGLRALIDMIPGVGDPGTITPIRGYDRGGILPGSSSWRNGDDQLIRARRGEGIAVSEAMRDPYEANRLLALNRAAIRGVSPGQFRQMWDGAQGFATGGRVHPISSGVGNTYRGHTGRDFPAPTGTQVRAAGAGTITATPRLNRSYGWHIKQRLDEGMSAIYAHLSAIGVSVGQRVVAGQGIGKVGSTGNSTGPHLHFEVNGSDSSTVGFLRGAQVGKATTDAGPSLAEVLDIPGKLLGFVSAIKSGLSGEWGQMVGSSVRGALDTFKGWAKSRLGFAGGTNSAPAGWSWVGEKGPELVNFRGGEQVLPHQMSRAVASGGSSVPVSAEAIAEALMRVGFAEKVRDGVAQGFHARGQSMFSEILEGAH